MTLMSFHLPSVSFGLRKPQLTWGNVGIPNPNLRQVILLIGSPPYRTGYGSSEHGVQPSFMHLSRTFRLRNVCTSRFAAADRPRIDLNQLSTPVDGVVERE